MGIVQRKLVLTGCRAGMTIQLGGYQFVNGYTIVTAAQEQIDGPCKYLGRSFKAFEEKSAELAHYQRLDREEAARQEEAKADGKRDTETPPERRSPAEVPSNVQPTGEGTAEVPSDDGSGADGPDSDGSRADPGGNGSEDSGDDGKSGDERKISSAIASLDADNDEHWTADGRPRVDAVALLAGIPNLTRRDIVAVAEDVRRPE